MSSTESVASALGVPAKKARRPYQRKSAYLPKWLSRPSNSPAQAPCLMILAVLSGQRTVSEAIGEAKISRNLYYQLEMRALQGMMRALDPRPAITPEEQQELRQARVRVRSLSAQVKLLTQRKRAAERLLRLMMKSSRMTLQAPRGRPPKVLAMRMRPGADSP